MTNSLTYADAGVDIDKANRLVNIVKKIAQQTRRSGVMGEIGGFGGLFSLNVEHFNNPVLVSSTDGVGTKLKIAFMMDQVVCPVTGQAFGLFPAPYGTIAGAAAQAMIGCFD